MVNDLFKVAARFHKLSQDPLAPVKAAVEGVLTELISTKAITLNTVSVIGSDCKVDVILHPTAGDNSGSTGGTNQSYLQGIVSAAVAKVNPSLKTMVTVRLTSEDTLPRTAQLRKNFAKFHKLAQCQQGDPLCDDLNSGLAPDESAADKAAREAKEKAAKKPVPKPVVKPDVNKVDDGTGQGVSSAIELALQSIPGARLIDVATAGNRIDARIEVPEQHSFTASQLGKMLTNKIQAVAPGKEVIPTLSFTTQKLASRRKQAQDTKNLAQSEIAAALQNSGLGMRGFVWQGESKHILVEVGVPREKKVSTKQVNDFLTQKIMNLAPGFTVITTLSTT